jgi:hypothetical protein
MVNFLENGVISLGKPQVHPLESVRLHCTSSKKSWQNYIVIQVVHNTFLSDQNAKCEEVSSHPCLVGGKYLF